MKILVKLFAAYRDKAGISEFSLEIPKDSNTVGDVSIAICSKFPKITIDPSKIVIAVNSEYQEHSTTLCDGDEVALIPPVSGG
ncbi:MAG: molybdopterin converting factor subunit 1 [Dehalococcoidia bacterium]